MSNQYDQSIWSNLNKIQDGLNLSDQEISDLLGLTSRDFMRKRSRSISLTIAELESISQSLNISAFSLVTGNFDITAAYKYLSGGLDTFPEKYENAKFSRVRTLTNFIKYIDFKYGVTKRNSILRKLQLHESMFTDPDRLTNIYLITDLCSELRTCGFDDHDLFNIGLFSYHANKESDFGDYLRSFDDLESMFVGLLSEKAESFDKNFDYLIKSIDKDHLIIESKFSELAKDHFRTNLPLGSTSVCQVKMGVFASFPYYQGYQLATVEKLRCVYQGDSSTIYKLNFSFPGDFIH